ncbi:MAG: hypothetical protein AAGF87_07195 [Bacteroidota bacterium]
MKYLSALVFLSILMFSCHPRKYNLEKEASLYFEYENLVSGESGVINTFDQLTTSMVSYSGSPSSPPDTFLQQFYINYALDTTSGFFPRLFMGFYPNMIAERCQPVPNSYAYTQLYTYEDPEDYVVLGFPTGDLYHVQSRFFFTYEPSYDEAARIFRDDLLAQPGSYMRILESCIIYDESNRPRLYVKGEFSGTLQVAENLQSPFAGQELFRINNGRFAWIHPIDGW